MTQETTTKPGIWGRLHIDPTISLGHILTTIMIAVSAIWWAQSVEARIGGVNIEIVNLKENDKKQETERQQYRTELREDLREIKAEIRILAEQVRASRK